MSNRSVESLKRVQAIPIDSPANTPTQDVHPGRKINHVTKKSTKPTGRSQKTPSGIATITVLLELEIASQFNNATESASKIIGYATSSKSGTLNTGVERTGCAPEDRMIPYVQELTLEAELESLINRYRLRHRHVLVIRVRPMKVHDITNRSGSSVWSDIG